MNILRKFESFITKPAYLLVIESSHCNLRCSMCPRGSINGLQNPDKGSMGYDLFKRIVDKFVNEKIWINGIVFGNWGEPLLDPDLPKMIHYAKSHPTAMKPKTTVSINTTFNHLPSPLDLLTSGVDEIVISTSGMTQEVYSRNHRGGNIEIVLKNIMEFAKIRKAKGLEKIKLRMVFHDYIYNSNDAELARNFCKEYGLRFTLRHMYICNVEDAICFSANKESLQNYYSKFIELEKEIPFMKTMDYEKIKDCCLRKKRIIVNFDGQLYRCEGVFEKKYFLGSIFDFKIKDIPDIESDICKKCAQTPISFRYPQESWR
jgi:MoaA/NifB/PqqE/SkfB family radical SAM enzyme